MMIIIAMLLFTAIPFAEPLRDNVEIIEKNHVCTGGSEGRPSEFIQWIFWRYDEKEGCEKVVHWQMVKRGDVVESIRGGYRLKCADNMTRTPRVIEAISYRETWTLYDPEITNRERLPISERRGLSKPVSYRNVKIDQ